MVPWHLGHSATWDVTVVHTLAASYVEQSAVQAGKAAEIATERKSAKYSGLSSSHILIPVAVESLGPLADDAHRFITEIGRRMTFSTAQRIREKRRSCTSAYQWRFNATTPCVLQTLSFPIRRSHSGHYHLHRHHRRHNNNNNNNNNNNTKKCNMLSSEYNTFIKTCRNLPEES